MKSKLILFATMVLFLSGCGGSSSSPLQVVQTGLGAPTQTADTVRINNCGGKADMKQTTTRSRTVTIEGGASLGLSYQVVQAAIDLHYGNTTTVEKSFELTAPPNTNMEFNLVWTEQSWTGVVTEQGQSGQAIYRYQAPLSVEVSSQRDLGCSSGGYSTSVPQAAAPTTVPLPVVQPTDVPNYIPAQLPAPAVSSGYYSLVSKISGLCLEIQNESQSNGAHVWQYGCKGNENQLWSFRQRGNSHEIMNRQSGKCISPDGGSPGDGVNLVQTDCNGGPDQLWDLIPGNSGYISLRAQPSGRCMDVAMGGRQPGDYIIEWPCNGGENQLWLRR